MKMQYAVATAVVGVLAFGTQPARAVFGVGDTTVLVGDLTWPAKWATELEQWTSEIEQAKAMVGATNTLVTYAGRPGDAIKSLSDLSALSSTVANVVGPGSTANNLMGASLVLNSAQGLENATNGLLSSVDGLSQEMSVFGTSQNRQVSYYQALAAANEMANISRGYLAQQASGRDQARQKLNEAWQQLQDPNITESKRNALLAQIAQEQAQIQLMNGQQQGTLADMELQAKVNQNTAEAQQRGREEQADAEGQSTDTSYQARQAAMAGVEQQALQTTPQTMPDWNDQLKTYVTPPSGS